ncbi:glycoside hydrolase [Streptomyces sp. NBC_01476]|uniref:sialidase family protein n=1 Tax=Streptomyces sp. NBC_01476 TaxID=2903881 RepID=UPI002E34BB0E|nr:sialidase family protein [Streptomyces sp. NBC_01476]
MEGALLQDPGSPTGVTCAPLLYSGPQDPSTRQHLTLRRSTDRGLHWHTVTQITGPTTPAAYSDITKADRTHVGIAYETGTSGPYERIAWTTATVTCP